MRRRNSETKSNQLIESNQELQQDLDGYELYLQEIELQLSSAEAYARFESSGDSLTSNATNLLDNLHALHNTFSVRLLTGFSRSYRASREAWRTQPRLSLEQYHQMAKIFHWAARLYFQQQIYECQKDLENYAIYIPILF